MPRYFGLGNWRFVIDADRSTDEVNPVAILGSVQSWLRGGMPHGGRLNTLSFSVSSASLCLHLVAAEGRAVFKKRAQRLAANTD